jgi:hypothetical protein
VGPKEQPDAPEASMATRGGSAMFASIGADASSSSTCGEKGASEVPKTPGSPPLVPAPSGSGAGIGSSAALVAAGETLAGLQDAAVDSPLHRVAQGGQTSLAPEAILLGGSAFRVPPSFGSLTGGRFLAEALGSAAGLGVTSTSRLPSMPAQSGSGGMLRFESVNGLYCLSMFWVCLTFSCRLFLDASDELGVWTRALFSLNNVVEGLS